MQLLEDRIRREGEIRPGGILKVDNFLNHQIDTALTFEMAKEFKRLFEGEDINKVLTIEASGIAMASMTAMLVKFSDAISSMWSRWRVSSCSMTASSSGSVCRSVSKFNGISSNIFQIDSGDGYSIPIRMKIQDFRQFLEECEIFRRKPE